MRKLPPDKHFFVPCEGGCDFVTPVLMQKAGSLRECQNYEIGVSRGYEWITGYERYDGRPSPSDASYTYLPTVITGAFEPGDTVTGVTSSATGVVIAVEEAAVIVTKVVGDFEPGEQLEVASIVQGQLMGEPIAGGAQTPELDCEYLALAADVYRADIQPVPGSGPIRGICRFNGVLYAWRNASDNLSLKIYKSTASGWQEVALGRELAFTSGGTYEIKEGDTLEGATSGATAVVLRVAVQTGSWSDGSAAGSLVFASQSGTFQSENLKVGSEPNVATIAGNSSAIVLAPGGRVKHVIHNFFGGANTRRIYGCDGVNPGFEFDGTVYVPIHTGMDTDKPENVVVHKQHLFFSFNASVRHSGTGEPFKWSALSGAAEIGAGDRVTGFKVEIGSESNAALSIMCRNQLYFLYGNDASDWQLVPYREEIGAFENSIQDVGMTVMVDDRGVVALRATIDFGNFQNATLSKKVQPWIQTRKATITDSCIVREKNQYRVFFEDKSALYVTFENGKVLGMMTEQLAHKVACIHSTEGVAGGEEIFFGSDDGYCYQAERGTSFDGQEIEYFLMMQYAHFDTPRLNKSYKSATIEAVGDGYCEFILAWELGYSDPAIHQPGALQTTATFRPSRWDSGNWDNGYWDGVAVAPSNFKLCGTAENIAFMLYGKSNKFKPMKFSGVMTRYQPRRILR